MNIKLNFNSQYNNIDVIYPINYSDRLDGLQDTISCEFYLNDDLIPFYHKYQKIIITIKDNDTLLKEFRMCLTDLNRELCSTYNKNSSYKYRYTLTACEPTVLINENIRTDIAITPYAYGSDTPYKTLYDAYIKICSCHNLNTKNEPIYNTFNYDKKQQLKNLLEGIPCPSLTYKDLSTYSQLEDIFNRVGIIPYLDFDEYYRCYITFYSKQGEYLDNEYSILSSYSSEELSKLNDYTSNLISTQVKNVACDNEVLIYPSKYRETIIEHNYDDTIYVDLEGYDTFEQEQLGLFKFENGMYNEITMGTINTYDWNNSKIKDANQYYVELPTNIENIQCIYLINNNNNQIKLEKLNIGNVLEYSIWSNLPASQQKLYAYFIRGENKINQTVALIEAKEGTLSGDWAWNNTELYKDLRKARFVIAYKPLLNSTFSYYDYKNIDDTTTKNIDLPYKVTNDKQISNLLSYQHKDLSSSKISYKIVTKDIDNLTNHFAGERVYYKDKIFNKDKQCYTDIETDVFDNVESLNVWFNPLTSQEYGVKLDANNWAKVKSRDSYNIYTISEDGNRWIEYKGKEAVITKMDVALNSHSIEISFELTTDIAQGSVIGSYSDNIRVSDNLSTETTVDREINIYKTFLLNCTAYKEKTYTFDGQQYSKSAYPSISIPSNNLVFAKNKNKFYLSGLDNLLLPSALINTKCVSKENIPNEEYARDVNKLNRLSLLYKAPYSETRYINASSILSAEVSEHYPVSKVERAEGSNFKSIAKYIVDNFPVPDTYPTKGAFSSYVSFEDNDTTITFNQILSLGTQSMPYSEVLFYKFQELSSSQIDKLKSRTSFIQFEVTNVNDKLLHIYYYDTSTSERELMYEYNMEYVAFPQYIAVSKVKLSFEIPGASNSNPIFISTNNIGKLIFPTYNVASLGNNYYGLEDNKYFLKTNPLFYKRSDDKTRMKGIFGKNCNYYNEENKDLQLTTFEEVLQPYGFDDLYIDIREKITVSIQYVVAPNNYIEFVNNNSFFFNFFGTSYGIYNKIAKNIAMIKEINTNFEWLNSLLVGYYDSEGEQHKLPSKTGRIFIKRIKKQTTMSELIAKGNEIEEYSSCQATMYMQQYNDDIIGKQNTFGLKIHSTESLTLENDKYDYAIYLSDTKDIPLMIINTEGCVFENNDINISYFLI